MTSHMDHVFANVAGITETIESTLKMDGTTAGFVLLIITPDSQSIAATNLSAAGAAHVMNHHIDHMESNDFDPGKIKRMKAH
jgi:hypothetical protein